MRWEPAQISTRSSVAWIWTSWPAYVHGTPEALPCQMTKPSRPPLRLSRKGGDALGGRHGPQQEPLLLEPVRRPLVGGAVDPLVGHVEAPEHGLPVEVVEVRGTRGWDEGVLHVAQKALHLALGLGPVRLAEPGVEAHPQRTVQEARGPHRWAVRVPPQHHQLRVVVQESPGHAAEVLEGMHVAALEAGQVGLRDDLDVAGPRPVQHHGEGPHLLGGPVGSHQRDRRQVDLRLLARAGLEA